ncbi:MAG: hypothetical protein ACJAYG_000124 [Oceanicoccus sp.]|jgi:uncharacterized protein (TIGR02444 family)
MKKNPIWDYTLSVYGKDGVSPILIRLQDEYGADVNLLLCACWLGGQGQLLNADGWRTLVQASAKWRAEGIIPLRALRRFLKGQAGLEEFRERVNQLEVDAEQWQHQLMLEALDELEPQASTADDAAQQNLLSYIQSLPGVETAQVMDDMVELLNSVQA